MSVLIKGMEMPDSCFHCKLAEVCQHYKAEHYANKRHEDCPLEEVSCINSEKTHDVINRQAAIDMFQRLADDAWNQRVTTTWANAYSEAVDFIEELPSAKPEPEHTMEEFMYGQELGDPEDGSL